MVELPMKFWMPQEGNIYRFKPVQHFTSFWDLGFILILFDFTFLLFKSSFISSYNLSPVKSLSSNQFRLLEGFFILIFLFFNYFSFFLVLNQIMIKYLSQF